jgi:hypothetical protein
MDRDFTQPPAGEITTLGRKSWTAFMGLFAAGFLGLVVIVPLLWHLSRDAGLIATLLIVVWLAYRFFELRTVHLYFNESGVWLYSGVLPWSRGVRGVKWRDVDDATFSQGFWTWMTKSHRVRVGHRFTRSNELVVSSIAHGDRAVMAINTKLQELARANRLS